VADKTLNAFEIGAVLVFRVTRSRLVEVIAGALEIMAAPETWTRGTLARDVQGAPVSPFAPGAVRFCAIGALRNAAFQVMQGNECAAMQLAGAIEFEVFAMGRSLECVNDGGGREAAIALLRKELTVATSRLAEHRSRALMKAVPPAQPGEREQMPATATAALTPELLP
jgi:hypothetical protein